MRKKCEFCNKTFLIKNLATHTKTHTAEKPNECDVCHKRFIRASDLVRHNRTHTGENPYECDICNKRFTQAGALVVHKRTHNGENRMIVMFVTKDSHGQVPW